MSILRTLPTLTLLAVISIVLPAAAQSGGPLTPPGPPGKSMKSLDQVEPATPLVDGAPGTSTSPSGTITISEPGSYYLTGNHTVETGNGIILAADGITLDLRGFTISSTAATSSAASWGCCVSVAIVGPGEVSLSGRRIRNLLNKPRFRKRGAIAWRVERRARDGESLVS